MRSPLTFSHRVAARKTAENASANPVYFRIFVMSGRLRAAEDVQLIWIAAGKGNESGACVVLTTVQLRR